jgi:hypothetical protein
MRGGAICQQGITLSHAAERHGGHGPSLRIVDICPKNAYKVNYLYIADRVSMYTRMFYTERGLLL